MCSIALVNIFILALSAILNVEAAVMGTGRGAPKQPSQKCGDHQQYSLTAQPCEKSCENVFTHNLSECRAEPGCQCEKGYIRDQRNGKNCIRPNECNVNAVRCPDNMQYNKCKHQEMTCNGTIDHDGKPGCYCKSGTFQNGKGECVEYQDCS